MTEVINDVLIGGYGQVFLLATVDLTYQYPLLKRLDFSRNSLPYDIVVFQYIHIIGLTGYFYMLIEIIIIAFLATQVKLYDLSHAKNLFRIQLQIYWFFWYALMK